MTFDKRSLQSLSTFTSLATTSRETLGICAGPQNELLGPDCPLQNMVVCCKKNVRVLLSGWKRADPCITPFSAAVHAPWSAFLSPLRSLRSVCFAENDFNNTDSR